MHLLWTFARPEFLGNSWPEGHTLGRILRTVLTQLNARMTPGAKKRISREEQQKIAQLFSSFNNFCSKGEADRREAWDKFFSERIKLVNIQTFQIKECVFDWKIINRIWGEFKGFSYLILAAFRNYFSFYLPSLKYIRLVGAALRTNSCEFFFGSKTKIDKEKKSSHKEIVRREK